MNFPAGQLLRPSDYRGDEEVRCDVAVVGAGAGGAATAYALAQAGKRVALVEEGLAYDAEELSAKSSWAFRHLYQERNTRLMQGNLYVPLPGGRAVGGSTLLNSAICFRGTDRVLSRWRDEHGVTWADPQALAPVYAEVEEMIGVAPTHPAVAKANNLLFKSAAEALGMKGDFIRRNAPGCIGCGLCHLGCPTGGKGSVDRNFIPAARELGAAVFTSARVEGVRPSGGAAVGVDCAVLDPKTEQPRSRLTVHAERVVLSAGAIGTPLLLLRQGLANQSGLVGKNLRVHTATGAVAEFEQIIDSWKGVPQGYYIDQEDYILETFSSTPDLLFAQFHGLAHPPARLRNLGSCGCMIGDESKGEVRPGPQPGRAQISYHLEEGDKRRLAAGLRQIGRIYLSAGAKAVLPGVHGGGLARSQAELERIVRDDVPVDRFSIYASHPMGTCRAGADRATSVVSPTGEVWDVKNLFIADASVFPSALGVNPQVTVMALALVTARGLAR